MGEDTETVSEEVDEATFEEQFQRENSWLLHRQTVSELRPWEEHEGQREGAQLPADSALNALAANRRVVDLLTERRWVVMRDAREAGASWAQIGEALGMTRQGATDTYRRAIANRAKVDVEHQTERAERAL
ncbi:MAG: hypothetical protein L0I76_20135 [Pseudonocardia sp.]|nr:hypothetical protein [Pseudonocardia sp.]